MNSVVLPMLFVLFLFLDPLCRLGVGAVIDPVPMDRKRCRLAFPFFFAAFVVFETVAYFLTAE